MARLPIFLVAFSWPVPGESLRFAVVALLGVAVGAALAWAIKARSGATRRRSGLEGLARTLDVGVIFLSASGEPEFANPSAGGLFGCGDLETLRTRFQSLRPTLAPALQAFERSEDSRPSLEIEIPHGSAMRRLTMDLERIGEEDDAIVMALVRERFASPEADLRLAAYVRSLARVHRAFAHEIRAPLNVMSLNLELLSNPADHRSEIESAEARRRHVAVIKTELRRLTGMMETLLSHFRYSCNTMGSCDLRELLRELGGLLDPYARQRRIELEITIPQQPIVIDGGRDAIQQALSIIVIETLEGMPEGGAFELSVATGRGMAIVIGAGGRPGARAGIAGGSMAPDRVPGQSGRGDGFLAARSGLDSIGGSLRVGAGLPPDHCFEIELPLVAAHD